MFFRGERLSQALERHKGIGPGFDFLRFGLAIFILYAHTRFALGAEDTKGLLHATQMMPGSDGPGLAQVSLLTDIKKRLYVLTVPMFFALSGFLVTGSAIRLGAVGTFLGFRLLRILPALCVEVILSALILGIFFSNLPLNLYISDPSFLRYFGNILGINWFWLPGVFHDNPVQLVNINLWTLPAEFYCYLIMAAAMPLGLVARRRVFLGLYGAGSLALVFASQWSGFGIRPSVWGVPAIVYCFFTGVVLFQWRDKIPLSRFLLAASVVAVLATFRNPALCFVTAIPLSYTVVYVGCSARLALPFLKGRDYSYGIYLYGFPITQGFFALNGEISRMTLFALALITTLVFAALSWHYVEKPFLRLKRQSPKGLAPLAAAKRQG